MAIPIETALGASLTSVKMTRSPADETRRAKTNATFTYNDGLAVTRWVDWGDHGLTLLSMDGTPAFYTVMTSDAYFDSRAAAKKAGVSFTIVDRLEELPEHHLDELVGDIDVRRLAALPRRRLEETHSASERFSLSQLYAAPPSPVGRARLGRRA
ncbi:hypothetical protein [Sphingomonas sp. 3-13AW]|uniref:hypothetical protein n=1 Tax=Sphingomonas sp. 3-13AW TaxID=3050450 RepID=UPI003BB5816F